MLFRSRTRRKYTPALQSGCSLSTKTIPTQILPRREGPSKSLTPQSRNLDKFDYQSTQQINQQLQSVRNQGPTLLLLKTLFLRSHLVASQHQTNPFRAGRDVTEVSMAEPERQTPGHLSGILEFYHSHASYNPEISISEPQVDVWRLLGL